MLQGPGDTLFRGLCTIPLKLPRNHACGCLFCMRCIELVSYAIHLQCLTIELVLHITTRIWCQRHGLNRDVPDYEHHIQTVASTSYTTLAGPLDG